MPELPEVEVCRLGIEPHVNAQQVTDVVVRHPQLRWPVSENIAELKGQTIEYVTRRSKYLLLKAQTGTLLLHLGMSGTIRVLNASVPVIKHDHFDLCLANGKVLRLNDPRRFGAVLWLTEQAQYDTYLGQLGPEPLTDDFPPGYLWQKSRNRNTPIKTFIMNNQIVVGVGNIYANEALFQAGILPSAKAGAISQKRYDVLTEKIKKVLADAIAQGALHSKTLPRLMASQAILRSRSLFTDEAEKSV